MKKHLLFPLRQFATLGALLLPLAVTLSLPAHADDDKVARQFSVGAGPDSVGRPEAGEDTEMDGPQAIYAGKSGEIYLLDQANGRVVSFDGKDSTGPTRSLTLPDGLEPTDMIATDSGLVVWDGKPISLEAKGEGLTRSLTVTRDASGSGDDTTLSMFSEMGSQDPGSAADAQKGATRAIKGAENEPVGPIRKLVATRGAGPVSVVITPNSSRHAVDLVVASRTSQVELGRLKLRASEPLGTVEFLEIDTLGRMFVLAEVIPPGGGEGAATFLARFAQNSQFEGIYELPLAPDVALARRFVTVSPDGDVYFLRTRKGVVDVLGVGFRPMKKNQPVELAVKPADTPLLAKNLAQLGSKKAIAAIQPLSRQRVIETAFGFEGIRWRLTPASYGPDPDRSCSGFNRIRRPGYMIGKINQEVRGVPYCWGCHGSLAQFANRVEHGALAGNVCTRNDPRPDVVGVDCSSFVSAAWGLSTHFTTLAIPSIATQVGPGELRPGDAFNKAGSHVMLFLGFTADRKVQVMEASPGACNGRVCRNIYPLASLLARGYVPRRFRALANDATAPVARVETPLGKSGRREHEAPKIHKAHR